MPIAATSPAVDAGAASAPPITSRVRCQISSGSCSTQPACGVICSCSRWSTPRSARRGRTGSTACSSSPGRSPRRSLPTGRTLWAARRACPAGAEIARTFAGRARCARCAAQVSWRAWLCAGSPRSRAPVARARPRVTAVPAASATALLGAAAALLALSVLVAALGRGAGARGRRAGAEEPPSPSPGSGPRSPGGAALLSRRRLPQLGHGGAPRRAARAKRSRSGSTTGRGPTRPRSCAMLERANARATFFMIGRQLGPQDRSLLLRELRDGDVLGDHTFSHPDLALGGRRARAARSARSRRSARSAATRRACSGRPYGAYNASVLRTARSLGLSTVLWNVDPADYADPGRRAIEQRVLAQVRPGSIIISHDGGGPARADARRLPRDHRQAAGAGLPDRDGARTARLPAGLRALHRSSATGSAGRAARCRGTRSSRTP